MPTWEFDTGDHPRNNKEKEAGDLQQGPEKCTSFGVCHIPRRQRSLDYNLKQDFNIQMLIVVCSQLLNVNFIINISSFL